MLLYDDTTKNERPCIFLAHKRGRQWYLLQLLLLLWTAFCTLIIKSKVPPTILHHTPLLVGGIRNGRNRSLSSAKSRRRWNLLSLTTANTTIWQSNKVTPIPVSMYAKAVFFESQLFEKSLISPDKDTPGGSSRRSRKTLLNINTENPSWTSLGYRFQA